MVELTYTDINEIPLTLHSHLFPPPAVSVVDFLAFELPPQDRTPSPSSTRLAPSSFCSSQAPVVVDSSVLSNIRKLSIPAKPTLDAILGYLSNPSTHCPTAICYAHLSIQLLLPPLIVAYWVQVSRLCQFILSPWLQAEHWLSTLPPVLIRVLDNHTRVQRVRSLLRVIPWTGTTFAFSDWEPTTYFATYLSSNWLSSTHIHQQLELLERQLAHQHPSQPIDILSTRSLEKLISTHRLHRNKYCSTFSSTKHLWAMGEQLANRTSQALKVAGIVNLKGSHWVAIAIDVQSSTILYGDSLGWDVDEAVIRALDWWVERHTQTSFQCASLPIGCQTDTTSCGLFAVNAVHHFFLPDHPLLLQSGVLLERLQYFSGAATLDSDMVCYSSLFLYVLF